uniref:Glycosyltransferase n=1 Tax=viral metagenome TaxID=1070528 RepID=A0A6C0HAG5_9ZZZZ
MSIKIIFYNFFNIGDTYFAQPFVKNIIDNNGDKFEYYILSNFNFYIYTSILPDIKIIQNDILNDLNINLSYNDLADLNYYHSKQHGILFINTWSVPLGYYSPDYGSCEPVSQIKLFKILLNIISGSEKIHIKYNDDPLLAIPIFPPNLDIEDFLNFKNSIIDKKMVFINNYPPGGSQLFPIHNVLDFIKIIDYFIKKNYVVLLPYCDEIIKKYKEENNLNNCLYFVTEMFNINIDASCYNVYFCAKVAHYSDIVLYFDTGKNFTYVNKEFLDDYRYNVIRNNKIHIGANDGYYKNLTNSIHIPDGYVKFIQANGGDDIVEKLEKSNYI